MLRVNRKTYKRVANLAKQQAMDTQRYRSLGALVRDAVMEYLEKHGAKEGDPYAEKNSFTEK